MSDRNGKQPPYLSTGQQVISHQYPCENKYSVAQRTNSRLAGISCFRNATPRGNGAFQHC